SSAETAPIFGARQARVPSGSGNTRSSHCLVAEDVKPRLGDAQVCGLRTADQRPSWHLNLNDCFLEGRRRYGHTALSPQVAVEIASGWFMRPDVPFIEALRAPPAQLLQTLWALRPQNQLRVGRMAEIQVRHEAASAAALAFARAQGLR